MPVWTGLGADNNWSTALNWGIDGSGNTGVPIATTSAFFTGVAPNGNKPCTITSGATCLNLDFTGYTGVTAVITFTNSLTVRGSITLSASMGNFAGANGIILIPTTSSSYTSNGKFFDKPLSTLLNSGVPIMTFIDNWRVSSFTTGYTGGGNPLAIAGVGIIVEVTGNFTNLQATVATNTFRLTGAGSTMSGDRNFTGNVNIDVGTGNTLNITNFTFSGVSSLFKWTSGTVNHTGTITSNANPLSLDLANVQFNNFTQTASAFTTLITDANFNNVSLGTASSGTSCAVNGVGLRLKCRGNLTLLQNSGNITGTATVSCIGTGTITSNCSLTTNFEVSSSGIYTLLSNIGFGGASRTVVVAGTLNTGATTATFLNGVTISTLGVNWFNVTMPAAATITINQLLSITGGLLLLGSAIFTGTEGWTTGNFTHGGFGTTCTLQAGNTYRVNGLFTMIGTALSRATLQSSDAQNVTVSIPALSDQMTLVTGTIPAPAAGYVLGSRAFTSALPAVLSNLLPDRPTILSGPIGSVYTLTEPIDVTNVPLSLLLQVGKKAFFRVTNGTGSTNVLYAQTRDIDSDGGITILAGQTFADNATNPNLFRTLNWASLVAPSGSVYYTFVN